MEYITPRPRISEKDVLDLAAGIQKKSTPYLNGEILSSLVKTAFYCGLKKAELLSITVGDVVDSSGTIGNNIRYEGENIPIDSDARDMLQNHLSYLKERGYSTGRRSPLFPKEKGKFYASEEIQYDLEKATGGKVVLEKIRQSGICRYYDHLKHQGVDDTECLRRTNIFARCSPRQVKGILNNAITPAGQKKNLFTEYLRMIESLPSKRCNPSSFDNEVRRLEEHIKNEPSLSSDDKELFLSELAREVKKKS